MKTCRRARCHAPSDCCGAAEYVAWCMHGDEPPEGWGRVAHRESHHSAHSSLMIKEAGRLPWEDADR